MQGKEVNLETGLNHVEVVVEKGLFSLDWPTREGM